MNEKNSPMLVNLVAIYATCLLIANVVSNHMLTIVIWSASAGVVMFPVIYMLSNIIGEVYGYEWARRASWIAMGLSALLAVMVQIFGVLPQPYWYDGAHFAAALGGTWRIVLASFPAFYVGKFADDKIFALLRGRVGFRISAAISSFFGHTLDTVIFMTIAFASLPVALLSTEIPLRALPEMMAVGTGIKWVLGIFLLPLSAWVVGRVKR